MSTIHEPKTKLPTTIQEATRLYLQDCKIRNLSKETIRRYWKGLQKFHLQLESL